MHPSIFDEYGSFFLAQVTALALVQMWRLGRQASRQELGNRPRPAHDGLNLVLTGLAVVLGLVLLIAWVAHPIILPNFGGRGDFLVPAIGFSVFIYVVFVLGIRSSHHTSGDSSSPWLRSLSMFVGAVLVVAAAELPLFLPHYSQLSRHYGSWFSLLIGIAL
ncbi:MAG TPA: hypothetical protein VFE08_07020, partial [Candidatus Sulfotelmatobacter sp.]|nr:hypothetical protein [Candidatus Sulfotelmatobacter sp.]